MRLRAAGDEPMAEGVADAPNTIARRAVQDTVAEAVVVAPVEVLRRRAKPATTAWPLALAPSRKRAVVAATPVAVGLTLALGLTLRSALTVALAVGAVLAVRGTVVRAVAATVALAVALALLAARLVAEAAGVAVQVWEALTRRDRRQETVAVAVGAAVAPKFTFVLGDALTLAVAVTVATSCARLLVLAEVTAEGEVAAPVVRYTRMPSGPPTTWTVPVSSISALPASEPGNETALIAPELIVRVVI